jgi:hypothetical protein
MGMRTPVSAVVAAVLLGALTAGGEDGGRPARARTPEEWVQRLGSDSYREREEATRRLLDMEEAYGPLEKARRSPDAEVRRRADLILGTLRDRVEAHAAGQLLSEVRPGRLEQLIARAVKERGPAGRKAWDEVVGLARTLTARAARLRRAQFRTLPQDPAGLALVRECPAAGLWGKRVAVAGLGHDINVLSNCLLVSAGPVKQVSRVTNSILLIDGDFAGSSLVHGSLIVCRGKVGAVACVEGSAFLVRGRLGPVVSAEDSLFQARELGHFTSSRNNVFLNHKEVAATFPEEDRFLQAGQKP